MPAVALPAGMDLLCYETLMADADEEYDWPEFDERTASSLCYTSGTTGKPKGVLYSHRSTVLHAYAINGADVFGHAGGRPGDAGGADVPRQRLGNPVFAPPWPGRRW